MCVRACQYGGGRRCWGKAEDSCGTTKKNLVQERSEKSTLIIYYTVCKSDSFHSITHDASKPLIQLHLINIVCACANISLYRL